MADRDAERLRREAQVRRSENAVQTGATASLDELRALAARLLREGNYDPAVLDARHPDWSSALEAHLLPAVTDAYMAGLTQEAAAGTFDATAYADRHLTTVRNRLVGVADSVFDQIRTELRTGRLQGEDIPTLAKRVDKFLSDDQQWTGRARTIARTEVIAANNSGARDAAGHVAGMLGHDRGTVVQQWLATEDARTRETHAEADGQEVVGLDATFTVGGYDLSYPGDPYGPPEETVNCRCTTLYIYPGDPGYPDTLTAGGTVSTVTAADTQESLDAEADALLGDTRPDAEKAQEARDLLARYDTAGATPPPALVDLAKADTKQGPPMTNAAAPAVVAPNEPAPDANGEVRWPFAGVMLVEDVNTGDGRKFTGLTWTAPPMPFRAQFAEQPGHDDARLVGRIESIVRKGAQITYAGTWDDETLNPDAAEARRHNINGQMRGVSIDADEGTISFEDDAGNPIDSEALWDLGPEDRVVMAVDGARIRALTACMIPAFVEAYCLDGTVADQAPTDSVTAATGPTGAGLTAAALLARDESTDAAPASVFADPGLTGPTPLTVTTDGRVFGHLATWGTCHIGIEGACVTPPTSEASYAYFLTGEYHTSDGQMVPVGAVTIDTGHAGIDLSAGPTVAHYDNTGHAAAYVNCGEDDHGIWVAGVLAEGLPLPKRQALQRSGSLSGDWRRIGGNLELVAALAVNVPGFPIPKVQSRVASAHQTSLVASGVVRDRYDVGSVDFSRAVGKAVERHLRSHAVRGRVRRLRAETTMQRINRLRGM